METQTVASHSVSRKELETVSIRFAGDSGDGMQVTGNQFTFTSAIMGNDINTFPDFPAEIRAPAGTLPGVSGFQLSFSSRDIHTPGDQVDVLVAMNPAALVVNLKDLVQGGILIVNTDSFGKNDLKKAELDRNPLDTEELSPYRTIKIPISNQTLKAVEEAGLSKKQGERCKNMYSLGIIYWLFDRPIAPTKNWLAQKFAKKPEIVQANQTALEAGYNYAMTVELFTDHYRVKPAPLPAGKYRHITGNQALALGVAAVAEKSDLSVLFSSYPITPASDILHAVSQYKHFGIKTFQAEDEIAAMSATVGAAFGGALALTSTSGPGLLLKQEALSLGVMVELPMVVIDVQRAGPSTGMPTKTEQADLLAAMYGRHGECPVPILAPQTPGDCFFVMIEAFQVALQFMTPVIILSDGYVANGAEPWKIPAVDDLPEMKVSFHQDPQTFQPYHRDPETLARMWAIPGTPGLEHRVGGLEKDQMTGNVSYDPQNHQKMTDLREQKILGIANHLPSAPLIGDESGDLLVVSWGGTYGAVLAAVTRLRTEGKSVSLLHLRYLHPFQRNVGEVLQNFKKVMVPELNMGQLCKLLRHTFMVEAIPFHKVQGKPFLVSELYQEMIKHLAS